jgi:predicted ATPase
MPSYRLLGETERLLWARLSVFVGGFDEDATVIVRADERRGNPRPGIPWERWTLRLLDARTWTT